MAVNSLKKLNRHVLRQALDAVPTPTLIIDAQHPDRPVVYANGAAGQALGVQAHELLGRSASSLSASAFDVAGDEPWPVRAGDGAGAGVGFSRAPLYEQPGRASYWLLTAAESPRIMSPASPRRPEPRLDAGSAHTGTGVFTATDVWARGLRDERTDPVTGIPGRDAFQELLVRDWSIARREQRRLSVMVFRVDALESYHQLFGRHATESCLRKVAHGIVNSLQRAGDYCARVGHDRFAVLISGGEPERIAGFAGRIAQRVRDLAIHHPRSQPVRYVTVSWGMASEIPPVGADESSLLEDAEARVAAASLATESGALAAPPAERRDTDADADADAG